MDTAALRELHDVLAWVVIGLNAVVGAWFVAGQYLAALQHRIVWVATMVAQLPVFAVAITGAILGSRDGIELDDMHALYGFSGIIAIGILYSYRSSDFIRDRQWLMYGIGSWFIMGLGLRNLVLGS